MSNKISAIVIDGKEIKREDFEGDFNKMILENLGDYDIERYAEWNLGMIEEDECECNNDIGDHSDADFIIEAKERGMVLFRTRTISDAIAVEQIKNALNY